MSPTNDEIIDKETKNLFEWIGNFNYGLHKAFTPNSTPSETEKAAIRIACMKMLDEARSEGYKEGFRKGQEDIIEQVFDKENIDYEYLIEKKVD